MDVNILNQGEKSVTDKYCVDTPEMRKINGDDVAVYHISNVQNGEKNQCHWY